MSCNLTLQACDVMCAPDKKTMLKKTRLVCPDVSQADEVHRRRRMIELLHVNGHLNLLPRVWDWMLSPCSGILTIGGKYLHNGTLVNVYKSCVETYKVGGIVLVIETKQCS